MKKALLITMITTLLGTTSIFANSTVNEPNEESVAEDVVDIEETTTEDIVEEDTESTEEFIEKDETELTDEEKQDINEYNHNNDIAEFYETDNLKCNHKYEVSHCAPCEDHLFFHDEYICIRCGDCYVVERPDLEDKIETNDDEYVPEEDELIESDIAKTTEESTSTLEE